MGRNFRTRHGFRTLATLATAGALLVGSVAAVDVAANAGNTGTDAVAAKKKKCKKKKKKKCKKTNFADRIAGKRLIRYYGLVGETKSETYNFCRDGTFTFRGDYSDQNFDPIETWFKTFSGTWRLFNASEFNAQISFVYSSYVSQYSDGSPGPQATTPPPALRVLTFAPNVVNVDSDQYLYAGFSGC